MVRSPTRFSFVLAVFVATLSGVTAAFPHTGQNSPASIGATQFRDIARRQNPAVGEKTEDIDGLTVRELTPPDTNRLSIPPGIDGALVGDVALDSAADDAELAVGDIIRAVNRHPVHTAAEARNELRRIEPRRPIFLLVWRHGTEVFLWIILQVEEYVLKP